MPEQAIRQAQRADDPELLVGLVAATTPPAYAAGRAEDAHGWLEWFHDRNLIEEHPQVAVRRGARRGALRAAPRAPSGGPPRPSRPATPPTTARRSAGCWRTSAACCAGAASPRWAPTPGRPRPLLGPQHGLHAAALLFEGLAVLLAGDPDGAEPRLAHAHDVALYSQSMPAATAAAAFRGFIAVGRKEWDVAEAFADAALDDRRGRAPPRLPRGDHRACPGRPDGQPPRRRAGRRRPPRPGRPGPAAVHVRRALDRARAARAGSGLPAGRRRRRGPDRAARGARPAPPASRPRRRRPSRPRRCAARSTRSARGRSAPRPSPPPSCGCCRSSPPTSRSPRSASGSTSPGTR